MELRYYRGTYEPDRSDLARFFKYWIGIKTKLTPEEEQNLIDYIEEYVDYDIYKDDLLEEFEYEADRYFDKCEEEARDYDAQVRESYYKDRI